MIYTMIWLMLMSQMLRAQSIESRGHEMPRCKCGQHRRAQQDQPNKQVDNSQNKRPDSAAFKGSDDLEHSQDETLNAKNNYK